MPRILILFTLTGLALISAVPKKTVEKSNEVLSIVNIDENRWQSFIYDAQLYEQRVDTFAKIQFWSMIMSTSDDWMIINQAQNRRVLDMVTFDDWDKLEEDQKEDYRKLLREEYCLPEDERIYVTRGKSQFYQFRKAMPSIDRGIEVFIDEEVDPWYAQSILLIESPGKLMKSPDGALGSFQLMSKVARKFGLRVDSEVDEREDFDRSAYGASQLIKTICLPYAREMMADRGVEYEETELWFRLLVLHIYHAGAYNVKSALKEIDDSYAGMDMIKKLWETESKGFKNASQNYSQVCLASLLQLDNLIHESCVIYHSSDVPVISDKAYPEGSVYSSVAEKSNP